MLRHQTQAQAQAQAQAHTQPPIIQEYEHFGHHYAQAGGHTHTQGGQMYAPVGVGVGVGVGGGVACPAVLPQAELVYDDTTQTYTQTHTQTPSAPSLPPATVPGREESRYHLPSGTVPT